MSPGIPQTFISRLLFFLAASLALAAFAFPMPASAGEAARVAQASNGEEGKSNPNEKAEEANAGPEVKPEDKKEEKKEEKEDKTGENPVPVKANDAPALPGGLSLDDLTLPLAPPEEKPKPIEKPDLEQQETGRCLVRSRPEISKAAVDALQEKMLKDGLNPELVNKSWDSSSTLYYLVMGRFERNADAHLWMTYVNGRGYNFFVACSGSANPFVPPEPLWLIDKSAQDLLNREKQAAAGDQKPEGQAASAGEPTAFDALLSAGRQTQASPAPDPNALNVLLDASAGTPEGAAAPALLATADSPSLDALMAYLEEPNEQGGAPAATGEQAETGAPDNQARIQAMMGGRRSSRGPAYIGKPQVAITRPEPNALNLKTETDDSLHSKMLNICWSLREKGRNCEVEGEQFLTEQGVLAGIYSDVDEAEFFAQELRHYGYEPVAQMESQGGGTALYRIYVPGDQLNKTKEQLFAMRSGESGEDAGQKGGEPLMRLAPAVVPPPAREPAEAATDEAPAAERQPEIRHIPERPENEAPAEENKPDSPLDALMDLQKG